MEHKILAVVKFNEGEALVLDRKPELTYRSDGWHITGTDGLFCACYFYETPYPNWRAFAGRQFEITLEDGTVVKCSGQFWDGVKEEHRKQLGGEPIRVTAASVDELKKCFVFYGYYAIPSAYAKLRKTYKGPIYDYWDYEAMVRGKDKDSSRRPEFPKKIPKKKICFSI